jgi:hypothetical protein
MKIVSSFKDYYDAVQYYAQDREVVYRRETRQVKLTHPDIAFLNWHEEDGDDDYQVWRTDKCASAVPQPLILGFCGTLVRCGLFDEGYEARANQLVQCHTSAFEGEILERYDSLPKKGYWKWPVEGYSKSIREFLARDLSSWRATFLEYRVPVFVVDSSGLTLNPPLRDYDFVRLKDPYACFQDIFRFLTNDLAEQHDPPQKISDEDMAAMKGFDEWSFRTPPGTKPNRKARKKRGK